MPTQTAEKPKTAHDKTGIPKPEVKPDSRNNMAPEFQKPTSSGKKRSSKTAAPKQPAVKQPRAKAPMKMANGRVNSAVYDDAAKVLERNGLTVSAFIRNSLAYVAKTGEVPESGQDAQEETQASKLEKLADFFKKIDAEPMPGKADYPGLTDDEMVERIRMERYGY